MHSNLQSHTSLESCDTHPPQHTCLHVKDPHTETYTHAHTYKHAVHISTNANTETHAHLAQMHAFAHKVSAHALTYVQSNTPTAKLSHMYAHTTVG